MEAITEIDRILIKFSNLSGKIKIYPYGQDLHYSDTYWMRKQIKYIREAISLLENIRTKDCISFTIKKSLGKHIFFNVNKQKTIVELLKGENFKGFDLDSSIEHLEEELKFLMVKYTDQKSRENILK